MKLRTAFITAMGAGAAYLALSKLRRGSPIDLRGKTVLITGGSRGLGLAIAMEFARNGTAVAVCARDGAELDRAQAALAARGLNLHTTVCDITKRDEVTRMVSWAEQTLGRIDILVNNAGIIKVGPYLDMGLEDFDWAMNVMFWGALHATQAVLPGMLDRQQGNIVNITSIGGKISVPHLLPYSCAKFAAVALSEGLRAELAPAGIRVTTIAPGLLRTGSHLHATFTGKQAKEYALFAAGAATPLVSIAAERAARSIVTATIRGDSEKILSVPADLAARLHGLFPGVISDLLGAASRLLPSSNGSKSDRTGADIEAHFNSRIWKTMTQPGQKAAERLNEVFTGV